MRDYKKEAEREERETLVGSKVKLALYDGGIDAKFDKKGWNNVLSFRSDGHTYRLTLEETR